MDRVHRRHPTEAINGAPLFFLIDNTAEPVQAFIRV